MNLVRDSFGVVLESSTCGRDLATYIKPWPDTRQVNFHLS
jgi:hypothetical protein